jgi:hypothetical protein
LIFVAIYFAGRSSTEVNAIIGTWHKRARSWRQLKQFSETQIVTILGEGDAGLPVAVTLKKHGISYAT